jgi:hypothetical protein
MMLMLRQIELTATFCLDKTGAVMTRRREDIRMTGPPSHPDTGITGQASGTPPRGGQRGGQRAGRPRWKTVAIVAIVIALLAVMVILHLTGTLGAGRHG